MTAFVDSFFWIALLSPDDRAHEAAVNYWRNVSQELVTSVPVLLEVGDALSGPATRAVAVSFNRSLAREQVIEIVPMDDNLWLQSWDLYSRRPDKHWSLTDCSSFCIMQQRNITSALTADKHFVQAGFKPVFKRVNGNFIL